MSELDGENDSSTPNENCNQDEIFSIIKVDDFVKYSDGIDDRMTEMARNFNEHNEINWSRWNHPRDVNEEDSDSEDETSHSKMPPPQRVAMASKKDNHECNVINKKSSGIVETEFDQEIDSCQEDLHMSENNFSGQGRVQELVRKFGVIKTLRQKENLKKENLPETTKFNPPAEKVCVKSGDNQKKETSEAFLGWIKSHTGKEDCKKESKTDNSVKSHSEEEDDEIDEIVKMLSNSSLVKDYYDVVSFPSRDEEIFSAFINQSHDTEKRELDSSSEEHKLEVSLDDDLETEFEVISPGNLHSDNLILDWKDDIAREIRNSFDGYEIDDQSSFHDWMVYHQGI